MPYTQSTHAKQRPIFAIFILCIINLLFMLTGCGPSNKSDAESSKADTKSVETEEVKPAKPAFLGGEIIAKVLSEVSPEPYGSTNDAYFVKIIESTNKDKSTPVNILISTYMFWREISNRTNFVREAEIGTLLTNRVYKFKVIYDEDYSKDTNMPIYRMIELEQAIPRVLENIQVFQVGRKDGPYKEYYYNDSPTKGPLLYNGRYKNGELEGLFEIYHPNGQLKYKATYKDGNPEGPMEMYKSNGDLLWKVICKDGRMIPNSHDQ